jgi:hypothetical protein
LRRYGIVEAKTLTQIAGSLGIPVSAITASSWVDNGPGWVAIMLATRDEVLALKPDYAAMAGLSIGVVAPWQNADAQFEVRAMRASRSGLSPPDLRLPNTSPRRARFWAGLGVFTLANLVTKFGWAVIPSPALREH